MIRTVLGDDEAHVLNTLKMVIPWEPLSMELCGCAEDGRTLLDLIRREQPQIVITDIVMPEMTGLEAARRAKAEFPGIHIILMSAYADFKYAREALQLGLDDLIPKPLSRRELMRTLEKVCAQLGNVQQLCPDSEEKKLIRRVRAYIQDHYSEKITLTTAAEQVYISTAYLSRLFKQETGMNFTDYLTQVRIGEAKQQLKEESFSVQEIAQNTGFGNTQYFSRCFRKETGMTPTEYRNQSL